jgi:outer membrane protein assembly factor BamB
MRSSDDEQGGNRALIIATGRYEDAGLSRLRSPSRDVADVAAVLEDPDIGGYRVNALLDKPAPLLLEEIEGFFSAGKPRDLLVLYLSCHGVKDPAGQLYFAAKTTKLDRLASTGISAEFVYRLVDRCRSRRVVVLLDCCYSGAYLRDHRPRAPERAGIGELEGRGRAVITSCTALEYSFEIDTGQVSGQAAPSVFTAAIVEGLRTGAADEDADGLVTVDDLYRYVWQRVREQTPYQTPEKKWGDVRGQLVIARNPYYRQGTSTAAAVRGDRADYERFSGLSLPSGQGQRRLTWVARRTAIAGAVGIATAAGLSAAGWELAQPRSGGIRNSPKLEGARPSSGSKAWSSPVLGNAVSVPVVSGGIVFVSTFYGGKYGYLYAFRSSDGRQMWNASGRDTGGFSEPVALSGILYFTTNGEARAVRASNGKSIWNYPIGDVGANTVPLISGGMMYAAGTDLVALRAASGAKVWSFPAANPVLADDVIYAIGNDSRVYALRASNGKPLWRSRSSGYAYINTAAGGMICVSRNNNNNLHALRASDGGLLWSFAAGQGTLSSVTVEAGMVLVGTNVYLGNGVFVAPDGYLYALRGDDGKPIWRFPARGGVNTHAVSGGVAYLSTVDGAVYALRAARGTEIWNFAPGGGWPVGPVVASTTILVGSGNSSVSYGSVSVNTPGGHLYALRASDGMKVWTFRIGSSLGTLPVVADSVLYAWSYDGNVYAIRI